MNAGDLSRKITIQQLTTTTNENGFPEETWADFATVWDNKRGLTGREYYQAAAVQSESDVVYTIRYSNTTIQITSAMRIIDGTQTYEIKAPSIDKNGHKRWLEIRASEVVPGGS